MKRVKVSVTAADIAQGRRRMCHLCPVALATARAFDVKIPHDVTVTPSFIRVRNTNYRTPEDVSIFIGRVDCGHSVQPFDFHLECA